MDEIDGLHQEMQALEQVGNLRNLRPLSEKNGCYVRYNGQVMVNMTSNDYLGIGGDIGLHREFYAGMSSGPDFLEKYGLGAASSRLLTGDSPQSHKLEQTLQDAYGREACLFFNSGYHANIGILPALTDKHDLILSDKLNHASIHDGMRLSRADCKRYRHCDYEHLVHLLEKHRTGYRRVVIVTESIFSMDGDIADLQQLVAIKNRFGCLLYVDEAHAVGVSGERGLGICEVAGVTGDIDLLVGTFGKAFASVGAYVLCQEEVRKALINRSRSFIFTTMLSPVVVHWNHFIFQKSLAMTERRAKLAELAPKLRNSLRESELVTDGDTHIVPVILGDNHLTVRLAEKMRQHGFLIFAVRPPTVPQGTSRFRLSLTATMDFSDIERLPGLIAQELK